MKFTDRGDNQAAQATLADDTFEQLQLAFYERLRKDRARLAVLSTALAHAVRDPEPALQELRTFAHRLRGAAAIFGAAEVRDAAEDLELATHTPPDSTVDPAQGAPWSAIVLLSEVLISATESETVPFVSADLAPASKRA
jgi:HPt (histidine-containing phosphotransfer) domain-containing protein